jgi:hypothetical protein
MKRALLFLVAVSPLAWAAPVRGQDATPAEGEENPASRPAAKPKVVTTPLEVQVTVNRYQGEKKTGSLPHLLQVAASEQTPSTTLRMGVEVPVPITSFRPSTGGPGKPDDNPPSAPMTSYQYRNVGTSIDCRARPLDDGRYRVEVTVEQSAVIPAKDAGGLLAAAGTPFFRTFKSHTPVILRDGQSAQFVAASDPVTGESVRIDVALRVLK